MISLVSPRSKSATTALARRSGTSLMLRTASILPPCRQVVVVEVGADVHPAPAQRQQRIVEVEQVRIVLIDEIARPVVEVLDVGHVGQRVKRMLDAVETLRIESLPPLFLAIGRDKIAIVWHSCQRRICLRRGMAGTTTSCGPDEPLRQSAGPVSGQPRPSRQPRPDADQSPTNSMAGGSSSMRRNCHDDSRER